MVVNWAVVQRWSQWGLTHLWRNDWQAPAAAAAAAAAVEYYLSVPNTLHTTKYICIVTEYAETCNHKYYNNVFISLLTGFANFYYGPLSTFNKR